MPPTGRGRFAPSPTGALHLGNLRTALLAWLFARHANAEFVLRIEDIDGPRVRPGCAEQMIEDLRWLGLDWDEGPDVGGPCGPYVQSGRVDIYERYLRRLVEQDAVYPCYCSRSDISEAASAPHGQSRTYGYPGTCRDEGAREQQRLRNLGKPHAYRYRAPDAVVSVHDLLRGERAFAFRPPHDDFVVWRSDGIPAYHLAVVVDDAHMRIDEIVRGEDLLDSAALQGLLRTALDFPEPSYAHVPLMVDQEGKRFSKRANSAGLRPLRDSGATPEAVVGMIAASCGLIPDGERCRPRDLVCSFDSARLLEHQRG